MSGFSMDDFDWAETTEEASGPPTAGQQISELRRGDVFHVGGSSWRVETPMGVTAYVVRDGTKGKKLYLVRPSPSDEAEVVEVAPGSGDTLPKPPVATGALVVSRAENPATLREEMVARMDGLFANYTSKDAAAAADWFKQNVRFGLSRTPSGKKDLKRKAERFHWFLQQAGWGPAHGISQPDEDKSGWARGGKEALRLWETEIKPNLDDLVRYFTNDGGKVVPSEMLVGANTYVNLVGFDEKKLAEYAASLESVFAELKGWRREALAGGVRVVLAGPKSFRGTAAGTYRSLEDALYVRATPNVLKRTMGTYGAFDYIIIHELGHRFERRNLALRNSDTDFDSIRWYTSSYSHVEGEAFAELFAISNFGIKRDSRGAWDQAVVDRFESLMGTLVGRAENPRPHAYLSLAECKRWEPVAAQQGVSEVARSGRGFLSAYKAAGGDPERLSPAWRARREGFIARHMAQVELNDESLFRDGMPSRRHLALIMWAYSPRAERLAELVIGGGRRQNPLHVREEACVFPVRSDPVVRRSTIIVLGMPRQR